jgi:hypothetical protein
MSFAITLLVVLFLILLGMTMWGYVPGLRLANDKSYTARACGPRQIQHSIGDQNDPVHASCPSRLQLRGSPRLAAVLDGKYGILTVYDKIA